MIESKKFCIFLRHGECLYNDKIYQNECEISLTKKGITDIYNIAESLKYINPDVIYASPFNRAIQSAEIISNRLNKSFKITDSLRERHFKSLANISYKLLEKMYSSDFVLKLLNSSETLNIENEETIEEAKLRVTKCLSDLMSKEYKKVLIISHGGPHSWLCCNNLEVSIYNNRFFKIDSGNTSIFEYTKNGVFQSIITLNNTQPHLYI